MMEHQIISILTIAIGIMFLVGFGFGYNYHKSQNKYYKFMAVQTKQESPVINAGTCMEIKVSYFCTVYGVKFNGNKKMIGKTFEYDNKESADKEADLMIEALEKRYEIE